MIEVVGRRDQHLPCACQCRQAKRLTYEHVSAVDPINTLKTETLRGVISQKNPIFLYVSGDTQTQLRNPRIRSPPSRGNSAKFAQRPPQTDVRTCVHCQTKHCPKYGHSVGKPPPRNIRESCTPHATTEQGTARNQWLKKKHNQDSKCAQRGQEEISESDTVLGSAQESLTPPAVVQSTGAAKELSSASCSSSSSLKKRHQTKASN